MKKLLSLILAVIMLAAVAAIPLLASAAVSFSDVTEDMWSYKSISYAVASGYMQGVGDGKFDPEGPLTRAMVATVLWRRENSPAPAAPSGFDDVPAGEWYSDAVAWAKENGVVNGTSEATFEPDAFITREQLGTMLFRFSSSAPVSVPERADLSPFADGGKVSEWATEPLEWAVQAGLIKGTDGNRLAPDGVRNTVVVPETRVSITWATFILYSSSPLRKFFSSRSRWNVVTKATNRIIDKIIGIPL